MSLTVPVPFTASASEVARLRAQLRGQVITIDDPTYDEARAAWNLAFDARPALVVEPASAADVAVAMRFADRAGLGVAVQATGHGVTRLADGALLLSTRRLDDLVIDPRTRTARLGAGVPWGPVLAAAQTHGLAPLAGSAPHVGAVGYTLGGGMGWLARKHGLSADKVRAFEFVTPQGELRRVTAARDPELFWALRGAGAGSLGVVTAMEIELVPVSEVYAGNLLYPVELAADVFARYRAWVADVPDELTSGVVLMNYPPLEEVPAPVRGRSFVVVRGCWCGPVEHGERLLAHWRGWRAPDLDQFGPMPFSQMAAISQDPVDPLPAVVTTDALADLGPAVAEILIRRTVPAGGPPELIFTEVRHGGGALSASDPDRGAGHAALREVGFLSHAVGLLDPSAPEQVAAHIDAFREELAPHRSSYAYLNFLDGEDRHRRGPDAFTEVEWRRLRAVKAAVDPTDRLRYGLDLPAGDAG
jgi:FAD/FMN-containing dehydrogenase